MHNSPDPSSVESARACTVPALRGLRQPSVINRVAGGTRRIRLERSIGGKRSERSQEQVRKTPEPPNAQCHREDKPCAGEIASPSNTKEAIC